MKKLILVMMVMGVLSSCSRTVPCIPISSYAKQVHTKSLRKTRHKLRVKYHYHQTRAGKLFNINIF